MKQKKIALVLSGGGFNGAFQLGALNYINENWKSISGQAGKMKFDLIAGVSAGALNGALVAMDKLELLNELWINKIGKNGVSEIYTSDILDTSVNKENIGLKINLKELSQRLIPKVKLQLSLLKKLRLIFSKKKRQVIIKDLIGKIEKGIKSNLSQFKAIADNTPLRSKLQKIVSKQEMKTNFYCGFVSLDDGKYHSVESQDFYKNEDLINGILASTAIPVIWEPVAEVKFFQLNQLQVSKNNIDGGIRNSSPLGDIIKRINLDDDDYKIIVINCNSGTVREEDYSNKSIGGIAARSIYNISMTEIFNNDLDHFVKMNQAIKNLESSMNDCAIYGNDGKKLKSFEITIINPHIDFDLGNPLSATKKLIDSRVSHGKSMAKSAFKNYQR